jgi:hypothetical protein
MMVKEIIIVYSETHKKLININADLLTVKAGGRYIYHSDLKD